MPDRYDYVIVGGGTAGSVLARRLTEDPAAQVLVLEAGGPWVPANVDRAPRWYTLLTSDIDWGYQSVPQPALNGRQTYEPRGRLPGGSSNLYIMMHVRGHRADFDNWAYQGAAGWSYADLAPYLAKLEGCEDPADAAAGTDGPQTVTDAGRHQPHPMSAVFISACRELGYPELPSFNGGEMLGTGWHQIDVKDGVRQGALRSYLEPALGRPNLTVNTGAYATRLLFDGPRCTGVRYRQSAATLPTEEGRMLAGTSQPEPGDYDVYADAEVILCSGAIESPKLLLLSGLGDPDRLRDLDIPVTVPLPGVGENFHNHVLAGLIAETTDPVEEGTQNLSEAALFATSAPGLIAPDLQLAFVHVSFDIVIGQNHPAAVSILPGLVRPNSRGWIRLASADPFDRPLINPNYLADGSDMERMVTAFKLSRDIFAAGPFQAHLKSELMPGPGVRSDAEIREFLRARADSYHHQAGSCRMGIDDLAVVDPALRVRGVDGLRVVDASVMPAVVSGNCHTAIVAIAERAADLIKGATHA